MRKPGTTKAQDATKRAKFEEYLRELKRKDEIMQLMGISQATYYRWLERSQKDAAKFVEAIAKKSYPLYFRRTIEGWEDQIKVLTEIRDSAESPLVKIQATSLIGEFIGAIQAAVNRGPSVLNVVENQKRQEEVEKLKHEVEASGR
jgi:mevalonate pyrophosphate decarboxylase